MLSKAKFLLQKRTVKDYKWHLQMAPFSGLMRASEPIEKEKVLPRVDRSDYMETYLQQ